MNNYSPDRQPRVAIVIVTWNSAADIAECLKPLADLPANWETFVVDNDSADETVALVETEFPRVRLIKNTENAGFAVACNQIVRQSSSEFVLFLNPDTRCTAESLMRALAIAESSKTTGVLGVRLLNDDGSLQRSCNFFPTPLKSLVDAFGLYRIFSRKRLEAMFADEFFDHQTERTVDWLMGAFLLCRRVCLERTGGIPEDYFMFGEDIDFCWQAWRAGFEVRFTPEVSIVHSQNKSAGQKPSEWRVERTILSRHLFCLKELGGIRGRFVQIVDFAAELLRGLRAKSDEIRSESTARRKIIGRAIFMEIESIRRRLNDR